MWGCGELRVLCYVCDEPDGHVLEIFPQEHVCHVVRLCGGGPYSIGVLGSRGMISQLLMV